MFLCCFIYFSEVDGLDERSVLVNRGSKRSQHQSSAASKCHLEAFRMETSNLGILISHPRTCALSIQYSTQSGCILICYGEECFRIIQLHGRGLVEWLRNAFLGWTLWMQYLLTEFSIFVALPNYSGMLCKTSPCQIHFNSRQTQPPYIYKIFN